MLHSAAVVNQRPCWRTSFISLVCPTAICNQQSAISSGSGAQPLTLSLSPAIISSPMYTITIILIVLLLLVVAVLLTVYFTLIHGPLRLHRYYASQTSLPVAPFRPIKGYIPQILEFDAVHNILGCWREQYNTYGAVHAINLGDTINLKLDDPHYLRGVMRTDSAHYHKSHMARLYLNQAIGLSNLLLLEDPEHSRHRKMMNPG